jgi:hypothetical protein
VQPILTMLLSAIANGVGASGAAGAQRDAANQALGVQRDVWGQQQANQAPYLQAGQSSLADLLQQMHAGAFDVNPSQLAQDPGYQFRMQQGQQALERSAAARGGLATGGTLRSLARYSQGVASDELQNAWTRRQGAFNRLASVANMGQGAANSLGQFGNHYADSASSLYADIGNANAAGQMGVANAVSGAANGIGGMAGDVFGGLISGGGMGGLGGFAMPQQQGGIPRQQGASTGYRPQGGFGLNYGGR